MNTTLEQTKWRKKMKGLKTQFIRFYYMEKRQSKMDNCRLINNKSWLMSQYYKYGTTTANKSYM